MFTPSHQMVLCAPFALQLFYSAPTLQDIHQLCLRLTIRLDVPARGRKARMSR